VAGKTLRNGGFSRENHGTKEFKELGVSREPLVLQVFPLVDPLGQVTKD